MSSSYHRDKGEDTEKIMKNVLEDWMNKGVLQYDSFLRRNQSLLIIIDRQPQYTECHHRRQSKAQ